MCLYIAKKDKEVILAEKPITCYKLVVEANDKEWQAIFKKSQHEYNKELISVDSLKVEDCSKIPLVQNGSIISTRKIEIGFHVYWDISTAEQTLKRCKIENSKIVKAIIPKGAEYCIGILGDIVSNKIIVTKEEFIEECILE